MSYPPELPVSGRRSDILDAIRRHQVVIVAGETGSGKTTQLPKMCLELGLAEPNADGHQPVIGHTQPRRLAARTVAERIATELDVPLGAEVGYQVRFTKSTSQHSRIKVMTDGILLAEIQHDPLLRRYSALIIDEAHERSLNIDFLLGYLKQILPQRPELKIIITSATIDPERFAQHFAQADGAPAPIIEVSGRTYPVEVRYRPVEIEENVSPQSEPPGENRDTMDAIIKAVDELTRDGPGDVLIFFSGEREIRDAADTLTAHVARTGRLAGTRVLPLYGRLSLAEQHAVFTPGSQRRIVLATNVAETSVTVPGITYVVDTGTARISRYSVRSKVQRLPIEKISQASARQRSGRCGRTSPGICIRLYSEEDFLARPAFTEPEILRTNLASVILHMYALGMAETSADIATFPFIDPPDPKAIKAGVSLLTELGALHKAPAQQKHEQPSQKVGALSPIGRKLAHLPIDPRLGRMIVESRHKGCTYEVLVLAAALSIQDPRERPTERAQQANGYHKRFTDAKSDFSGLLLLWRHVQERQAELSRSAFRRLCKAEYLNYLRVREWQELATQLQQLTKNIGFLVRQSPVDPVGRHEPIHQCILAGFLTHIGLYSERRREYVGVRGIKFALFPGSALFKKNPPWVVSAELVDTSRLWGRVNAAIDPAWVEQLAGEHLHRSYSEPHWSTRMGAAMAHEKVTFYGLPIVPARRILYGKIDPEHARELFIRHALVEGQWRTHHTFFHKNRKVLAQVEEWEHRLRRRDLRIDDDALFAFYDEKIPDTVISARHFDSWWKKMRYKQPDLLQWDVEAVLAREQEELDEDAFPPRWQQQGFTFSLTYRYGGDSRDGGSTAGEGITVTIPVLFLSALKPEPFSWSVPGMRVELITALIRSLPKPIRKHFVPAADVAREAVAALEGADGEGEHLERALERVLPRLRQHPLPPASWNGDAIGEHLKMQFRIVDGDGGVLGEGRDLAALQRSLAPAEQRALSASLAAEHQQEPVEMGAPHESGQHSSEAVSFQEQHGLTHWPATHVPRSTSTRVGTHTVTGYPALVDEGQTVGVRAFARQQDAENAHRAGVLRLLLVTLPSPTRYVLDHLSAREKVTFSHYAAGEHVTVPELIEACTRIALRSLIAHFPRSREEFTKVADEVNAQLVDTLFTVTSALEQALLANHTVALNEKPHSGPLEEVMEDIRRQRGNLLSFTALGDMDVHHMQQLPRYLSAIGRRLEKFPQRRERDLQLMDTVHELTDEFTRLRPDIDPEDARTLRWMLEELRSSFFAEELGTAYPVSEKRFRKFLSKAQESSRVQP